MDLKQERRSFYGQVAKLAIPIAGQSLITVGVNALDNIMVGQLEDAAVTATSQASSFISIYHIFCMGLGMGASVLVSRYAGMKKANDNTDKAAHSLKQTVALMLRLTLGLATLFALATLFFPELIMSMYSDENTTAETIAFGVSYLRYSVVTYFFLGLSLVCTIVLRSVGNVFLPLFVSIGAFFVNFGANYTFIFGHFGAPELGVAGAALGTLIARIFEAVIIVGYLLFKDKDIGFRIKDLFMNTKSLRGEYIRICIPVLISDGILALGNNTVMIVIGKLDDKSIATANAITATIQQLSTVLIQGVCQAGAIITGQTLGLGEKEKTLRHGWRFLGIGLGLGTVSALFIMLFSDTFLGFYNVSPEAVAATKQLMVAINLIIIFQATNSIMTKGVLRGGGDTKMLMITDNIFLWVISIPLGILAGFVFHLSPFWIYVCLKCDQIIKTGWCILRLKSQKWIKKINTGNA